MLKEVTTIAIILASALVKQGQSSAGEEFFLGGVKPTLDVKGEMILQKNSKAAEDDPAFYATMYNTAKKWPAYSANIVTPANAEAMKKPEECPEEPAWREYGKEQAVYDNKEDDYTPGQMNPCAKNTYAAKAVDSTFTYSNTIPQAKGVNWWKEFETNLAPLGECGKHKSTLYFLTGVAEFGYKVNEKTEVGEKDADAKTVEITSEDKKDKLSVPPLVWTVVCCFGDTQDYQSPPSLAFIAENKEGGKIYTTSLGKLQKLLGDGVVLFPGDKKGECMPEEDLENKEVD